MNGRHDQAGAASKMIAAIQKAGYDTSDEKQFTLGFTAFQTAQILCLRRLTAMESGELHPKVGRNQPCPCGSGKKYKRCCLDRQRSERTSVPRSPEEEPALIPRMNGLEEMYQDFDALCDILETDNVLREVRFDRKRAAHFLTAELQTADTVEATEEQLDVIAQRYFLEVEDGKLPGDIIDKLFDAAARVSDVDVLRSLALGVLLGTATETMSDGPNPLVAILFRLSIKELVRSYHTINELVERLGGEETVRTAIATSDQTMNRKIEGMTTALKPEDRRLLEGVFDETTRHIEQSIRQGGFPVPLSLVSVLPLLVDLARFSPETPTASDLKEALLAACDGLVDEDLRLYGKLLQQWLDTAPRDDPETTSMVSMVFALVTAGSLQPLDWPLMISAVQHGGNSLLPGEDDLLAELGEDFLEPSSLERYADFLENRGYVALAQRTRELSQR